MVAPITAPSGVPEVEIVPSGYRGLHVLLGETEKAVRFTYYAWTLWLPKKAVVKLKDEWMYYAQGWAIETSKQHPSAVHNPDYQR
jgi:hypothetical protein